MKKYLLFLAVVFTMFGVVAADIKIAVVDMDSIFESYYKTKIADATLKQQAEIYKAWIGKLNDSMAKLEEEFKILRDASQNIAISAAERENKRLEAQKKYRELREKNAEIEQYTSEKTRQYKELEAKKRQEILDEIKDEVKRRATLEGYSLVLDKSGKTLNGISAVIYNNPTYDITEEVVKEINRGHREKKEDIK
ncbi:MAG: OmpH family outer membrane protein [Victivallaceae bacterium]